MSSDFFWKCGVIKELGIVEFRCVGTRRSDQTKRFAKIVQQQVTVAKSMRVNTTVACDWLNVEFQSLRLILVAIGSRRANTRVIKESPRVDYCGNQQREFFVNMLIYSSGNQQLEFLTHLLVYAPAGLLMYRLVLMT
ncbi:hypothetical protein F511_10708 [Dorcoceras hygrometricum]|uniref:Uncharacterized protein n=1 Tax=Dorcoceras hygrometricum TaxID=472368 RepID=A0A2Z7BNV3_9LAMI|nr:hypothetical protein F511_10708 [Dorcoceras hygrometricum]